MTYPMLLKSFLYGQEAIEHKGGRLAVAWKRRGDVRDCSTHRSLLVSSHIGKTLHRALRQRHHCLYTQYMQTQQLGGRPHMPVGIPLHLPRAFLRWQHRLGRPTAIIFLDLTEAFYRVIRPFALGGRLADDDIALIAARLGLSDDTLRQFHHQLRQPSSIQQAGASPVVQRFLQALHTDTWFRVGQEGPLVRTTLGSRPGDSYADVVFGLLWAQLLRKYEAILEHHQILEHVPVHEFPDLFHVPDASVPTTPFLGPTWMDDLAVCVAADSNNALERKTGFALSLLLDLCHELHMEPNLRKGKTEVSVVSRYVHLGGVLHHNTVDRLEVSKRLAVAHQAFTLHRKVLYHNLQIPWEKRKEIFGSLVLSKLLYGLESWALEVQKVKDQFYAGVMRLYKRLLRVPHDQHVSDLDLLARAGLPLPDEILRCCRLRYYGTLHNCRQAAHWGLLQEDHQRKALLPFRLLDVILMLSPPRFWRHFIYVFWIYLQMQAYQIICALSSVNIRLVGRCAAVLWSIFVMFSLMTMLSRLIFLGIAFRPVCVNLLVLKHGTSCVLIAIDQPLFLVVSSLCGNPGLACPEAWDFLRTDCYRPASLLGGELPMWESWYENLVFDPPTSWTAFQPLPRSLCRHKLILHAYAGRRRRGDIEWFIDALAKQHEPFVLQVVSVDLIIDAVYGDIAKEATRRFWLTHILDGYVVAFIAGPRCNTWSRARNHALDHGKGPRVVRTPQEPWGKASLSLRELHQVHIGTLLLGFAFHCMAALAMRSGAGILEHPKEPDSDDLVSIWKLPILRMLLMLPGMRLISLAQGLFGAQTSKPTSLLVLGLSTLERELHAHRVTVNLPSGSSVGKTDYGQFRTAPLKEYPPSMCQAIATALCADLVSSESDTSQLPAELVARCTAMSNQLFGTFIGHDG
eukprot:s3265_g14.t1